MRRLKTIMQISSSLLYILSFLLLVPLVVAWLYKEPSLIYKSFIYAAIFSCLVATVFKGLTRNYKEQMDLTTAMILCTVSWVLVSVIGAIPFMIGLNKGFVDALFEAVSGFTTTGITVFEGLDSMSQGLVFWRSFIQWLGGLGILTFFLFVTTKSKGDSWQLFSAEGHKINSARPVPNVYRTIKYFWMIYAVYTVLEILALWGLGMGVFDALIHSMTTLSTGGFSNHDASIGYYQLAGYKNYILMEYTVILFMFLGGINFLVHYRMIKEDRLYLFKDIESRVFMKIIVGFTGVTLIGILVSRGLAVQDLEETIRKTLFQIVSVITTTGFGTDSIGSTFFPSVTKQLFVLLMIIGGCVGSTSGGIKVLRVVILEKILKREVQKIALPNDAVLPTTINHRIIEHDEIMRITAIVFGWLLIILIGAGITAVFSDLGPFEAFSGMASAVGNIGPFYFSVAKMASLSWVIKVTYIIGMLAGRLELLPIYIIISRKTWK